MLSVTRKFLDICDEKATVLFRSMMIKAKNTLMRLVYHGATSVFSAFASSMSVDHSSDQRHCVFELFLQSPARFALPFFFYVFFSA